MQNLQRGTTVVSLERRRILNSLKTMISHVNDSKLAGWYRKRKRAAQRLKVLSQGTVELAEPGYRGDAQRHLMRHSCGCLFTSSLHELAGCNPNQICPFCSVHSLVDLTRFGSADAVRELIAIIAGGKIDFSAENRLGSANDIYGFSCQVHRGHEFYARFSDVVNDPDKDHCPLCAYWAQAKRK